jgi:hypothetical protein
LSSFSCSVSALSVVVYLARSPAPCLLAPCLLALPLHVYFFVLFLLFIYVLCFVIQAMARADAASAIAGNTNTFSNFSSRLVFKCFRVLNVVGDCEIVFSRGCPFIRTLTSNSAVVVDAVSGRLRPSPHT